VRKARVKLRKTEKLSLIKTGRSSWLQNVIKSDVKVET